MTQKNTSLQTKWELIAQSQIESAARAERIEQNQAKSDEKIDRLVSAISELTNTLTVYSSDLRHTNKDVDDIKDSHKELIKRVTVLEIDGASRETKLKIIIGTMAAVQAGIIAWFIGAIKGP